MAIENGRVRGFRITGIRQFPSGKLAWLGDFFDEDFGGNFSELVAGPVFFTYTVTAGNETYEDLHASCEANPLSGLQGRKLFYPPASQVPRPSSNSVSISQIGGVGYRGISYAVGESPVTVADPPCGPRPWIFIGGGGSGGANEQQENRWVGRTIVQTGRRTVPGPLAG